MQAAIDKSIEELGQVEAEYNDKKAIIDELYKQLESNKAVSDEAERKFKNASTNYKTVLNEIKQIRTSIDKNKTERKKFADEMEKQRKGNEKDFDHEREDKEMLIREIEDKIKENSDLSKTKQNEGKMYDAELERLNKMRDEKNHKLSQSENMIRAKETQIEDFKRSSKNKILRFGNYVPDLLEDIKRLFKEGKFEEMPRGPIGNHIEVKDTQWSKAIEQCIGWFNDKYLKIKYE